jgi:ubiquinone/menaquinone biosynthesis C-methylase UbiE
VDQAARQNAVTQWSGTACGELPGDKEGLEYFLSVQADRYEQQPWQRRYFRFDSFRGRRVLEIGVGQGTDLSQFAASGAICAGVDITENHLHLARRNFQLRGVRVELHTSDATRLPFADGSLDCVYSFGVIHHIPEDSKVIREIFRVLRPGGTVMVAFYYKWSMFHLIKILLFRGLLQGKLFTLGYDGLLSTIETGANGTTIKPYVKLYTKREMRRLFGHFVVNDVSVHQFSPSHFLPRKLLGTLANKQLPLERFVGWYVACTATKPGQP